MTMKTNTFTLILAAMATVAAASLYSYADTFIVNKTNGLQERVEATQVTFNDENIPVLSGSKTPVTEIADIRRAATADFIITTRQTTYHSFIVDVVPKDKSRNYATTLMQKSRYDSCENRDDVHFFAWDSWRAWAELEGITVEEWVQKNGLLRRGDSKGLIASNLKPSTDYVLAVYYTDAQGHIDGTVHTAEVRTQAVKMLDTSFDISVDVHGKTIDAKIRPSDKNVLYWHGALSKKELQDYGGGDLRKAVEGYLYAWRSFFGKQPEDFFPLIVDKGDKDAYVDNLNIQTDYAYIACALDSAMNICSRIDSVNFHTNGILPSDNKITTTLSFVGTKSGLIDIKTTNQDPYIAWFMTDEEAAGRTPEAIIDSLEKDKSPGDLFYFYRRNGNSQIYKNRLVSGKKYQVLVFGYQSENLGMKADAEVTTTPEMISFTTPEKPGEIDDLGFYFQCECDGNKGAYGMAVPSENNMPFYLGYSTSGDKETILAELKAKAAAESKSLNEYLLSKANTSAAMFSIYLKEYAMEGASVVEPGVYHAYAVALRPDGTPVDKFWFANVTFPIGVESSSASPAKSQKEKFMRSAKAFAE